MALISVREDGTGDFTSLEAAVEAGSTVDGDVIEISGTWSAREDSRIAVADNLTIRAVGESKHPGRPWQIGDTHYQHRSTSNTSGHHSFTITNSATVLFEDMDIQHAGTGVSNEIFRNNAYNTFIARRCILGFETRTDQQDIYYNEYLALVTFECCHFYNAYRAVVDLYGPDNNSIVNINSCTGYNIGFGSAYNSRNGLVGVYGPASVTVNVFNTLCHTNALSGSLITASDLTTAINLDHVVTNDNSLSNVALNTDTNNVINATITDSVAASAYIVTNLNTGSFDFRLIDHANNLAQDNHTNDTGLGLSIPATDLIGTARPQNSNYDLGAFEISAVVTVTITDLTNFIPGQTATLTVSGAPDLTGVTSVDVTYNGVSQASATVTSATTVTFTVDLDGFQIGNNYDLILNITE